MNENLSALNISSSNLRVSLISASGDLSELIPNNNTFNIIGFTINKKVTCVAYEMPEFRDFNFRICYRNIEYTNKIEEIKHPFINKSLKLFYPNIKSLNLSCLANLPSGMGLGSSGAFAVCFTKLMEEINNNKNLSKYELFRKSFLAERTVNKYIGFQDHLHSAFDGFNHYEINFENNESKNNFRPKIKISPIRMSQDNFNYLNSSVYLYKHTRKEISSKRIGKSIKIDKWKNSQLIELKNDVDKLVSILESSELSLEKLGKFLIKNSQRKFCLEDFIYAKKQFDYLIENKIIWGGRMLGGIGSQFSLVIIRENVDLSKDKNFIKISIN